MNQTVHPLVTDAELDRPYPVVGLRRDFPAHYEIPEHHHARAQLVYASQGVMRVRCPEGTWVVPPQRALWMPGGMPHAIRMVNAVSMRTLYVDAQDRAPVLPVACVVVAVPPLLREVILTLVQQTAAPVAPALPASPASSDARTASPHAEALAAVEPGPALQRLMAVFFDLLATQPAMPLHLPQPTDPRLRRITDALQAHPGDARSLERWARGAGASGRTLARLFLRETGMSFRSWRQQLRLLAALERLAEGQPVTAVALDLGYAGPSAFVAMFRRSLGLPPGRYFR